MFEWDEARSNRNLSRYGLSFEDAETVLSGRYVSFEDDRSMRKANKRERTIYQKRLEKI